MLENCKRLICSPSLNKVYCIVKNLNVRVFKAVKQLRNFCILFSPFKT